MSIYPGPGAGGGGVGDVTADPAITNWDAATDGMFLASNGDATATFEALPTKGTGATDGHVWTADGANGAGWEAPSVGGLLTPDGLTSLSLGDRYNVKAYKASGSPNDFHCTTSTAGTTTVTTKDSAGAARTHDFVVGQGVCIHGAGAACAISAPVLTFAGATVSYATAAGTAYTFTVNTGTDVVTLSAAAPVSTGDPVRVSSSTTLPAGLAAATTYYWREATSTTGTLYDTSAHAIAGGATGLIDITTTGTGTHTMVGYTEYRYTTRGGDGYGGWTAATAEISVFNWVFDGGNANYNQLRLHVPSLARSMAIYGNGTSGRRLRVLLEARALRSDNVTTRAVAFSGAQASGTKLRVTVPSGHGIQTGDVVYLNWQSSGDSGFNGQFLVETAAATTLTMPDGTWQANMGAPSAGSGMVEGSFVEWRDYGETFIRQATSGLPDFENPPLTWAATRCYVRGDLIVDSSGRIWRAYTARLDREAGAVEPTWTATANARITDEDLLWEREAAFVPTNDTDGAQRQMLLTTVATTPTASTFTTTDAAGADISSNALVCQHNDALAIRAAQAAIVTAGVGGTLYFPAGRYNCILPDYDQSAYWTNMLSTTQPRYAFLRLDNNSAQKLPYGMSVECDPAAHIRCLCAASELRADTSTATQGSNITAKYFIAIGGEGTLIRNGLWTWDVSSGAISEHNAVGSYGGGMTFVLMVGNSGVVSSTRAWNVHWHRMRIHFPEIVSASGNSGNDNIERLRWKIESCYINVGGGDSNSFNIPKGDFEYSGGEHVLERRLGSHGFYIQGGDDVQNYHDFTMRGFGIGGKNAFSVRASSGDQPLRGFRIHNVHFDRVTGPIRSVDASTSNRCVGMVLSNLTGRPNVVLAEDRDCVITNCDLASLTAVEDIEGLEVSNCTIGTLDLRLTTAYLYRAAFSNVTVRNQVLLSNVYRTQFNNLSMHNPFGYGTNLRSALYEWVQIGATQEYYCRLRATGGDPGISSPDMVVMRDKHANIAAGTLGALTAGQWYYGEPTPGTPVGYNTVVVHMGDASFPSPDSWPYGSVYTATVTSATIGIRFTGYVEQFTIDGLQLTSDWADLDSLFTASGASFGPECKVQNFLIAQTGLAATGTAILVDFGSTALARCDSFEFCDGTFRQGPLAASNVNRHPLRINLGRGGELTLRRVKIPYFGAAPTLTSCIGNVHVIECEIQTNVLEMDVNATANTFVEASGYPSYFDLAGNPIVIKAGRTSASLTVATSTGTPASLSAGQIVYIRSANDKAYPTLTDAGADTNAYDVTTANGPIEATVLDAARTALQSGYESLGDGTDADAFGICRGNRWRGSDAITYAQIGADQNNYVIRHVYDVHRLSTDASRTITGFVAPAAGTRSRRIVIRNVGAQDIVYAHASGSSSALNRFNLPGAANYTQATMTTAVFDYDVLLGAWVLAGNST